MGTRTTVVALALFTSIATAAPKRPTAKAKAAAKKHMEKAATATTEGRHQDALTELDAAYKLDPQPMLLLARGHLYVKLEKCEEAIKLYEQFLGTKPAQDTADSATAAIESCKAALAPPPPPPPPPSQVTSEQLNIDDENPTLTTATRPDSVQKMPEGGPPRQVDAPSTRRPWFKDPILIGLGVAGAAAITGSVVLYTSARGKLDDAEVAPTYGEWSQLEDDAHRTRLYSIICGAAGAALVGGAVIYGMRRDNGELTVSATTRGQGGIVSWVGSF